MKVFKPYRRLMAEKITKEILTAYAHAPDVGKLEAATVAAIGAVEEILHDARLEMVNALVALPNEEMEESPE